MKQYYAKPEDKHVQWFEVWVPDPLVEGSQRMERIKSKEIIITLMPLLIIVRVSEDKVRLITPNFSRSL